MSKLTKEDFLSVLDFIKEQRDKETKFIDVLELLSPQEYCNAFIYSQYEDKMVNLLRTILDDESDDIGYFLYEMEQGTSSIVTGPTDQDGNVLYSNAAELYDYLMKKADKAVL